MRKKAKKRRKTPRLALYKIKDNMPKRCILRGVYDIRRKWINLIVVPALRDAADHLSTSKSYSAFSLIVQELIAESEKNNDLKAILSTANVLLNEMFKKTQDEMLQNAKDVTSFDGIRISLTKNSKPEELAKNISLLLKLGGKEFEISQVGTGTQSAVIIALLEILVSRRAKKSGNAHKIFVIEEPELFLHPHAIRRVVGLFKKLSCKQDFQLIISTHSPEIALLGMPFNFYRFNLQNNKTEIEKITREETLALKDKAQRTLSRLNSEMLFARSVILVEGDTEQALISILSDKYAPAGGKKGDYNLDRLDISIVSMGGNKNYEFYYRYLTDLGIKPYFLFDGDIPDTTIESLIKLFDIKESAKSRADKIKELDKVGVHILNVKEIEDLYPNKILAKIIECTEDELKAKIDNKSYFDKRNLLNSAIRQMIKKKQNEILDKNMDVEESSIDLWLQEERKALKISGDGGEKRRGKAIADIFFDMGKVRLGTAIGELIIQENVYPAELMTFIGKVCEETKNRG